jgi:hypothetical protein
MPPRPVCSARYERRSLLITANQPFGEWGKIFPDQAMTLAAIDHLVHHATILEMNVDSYRRKAAVETARGVGRPPTARQSNRAPPRNRLHYRRATTIILPPRPPKWPS